MDQLTIEVPNVRPASSLELLAMNKAVAEKACKLAANELAPGDHTIDTTIRIMGTLKKGQPFPQSCPLSIPWQTLFKMALTRLNVTTGRSIEELVESLVTETADGLRQNPNAIEAENEKIKPHVQDICERLISRTTKEVQGRITAKLNVVVLSPVAPVNNSQTVEVIDVPAGTIPTTNKNSSTKKTQKKN